MYVSSSGIFVGKIGYQNYPRSTRRMNMKKGRGRGGAVRSMGGRGKMEKAGSGPMMMKINNAGKNKMREEKGTSAKADDSMAKDSAFESTASGPMKKVQRIRQDFPEMWIWAETYTNT